VDTKENPRNGYASRHRRAPVPGGRSSLPTAIGPIEIVLPVHNEAGSIAATLNEFYEVVTRGGLNVVFRAYEDGSTDGTQAILHQLEATLPLSVDCTADRRGYSRAVIEGLQSATAAVVGFIDSDGQCDPNDLVRLAAALDDNDIAFGYRNPRVDTRARRAMSGAFGIVFRLLFHVDRRDPSCPYMLVRREVIAELLAGRPGILRQGFWWEFSARVDAAGLRVVEVPVNHRKRAVGVTQVYRPAKVPRIAVEHLAGLLSLRHDLAQRGT
jgi:dolichol-phosphate mannosyltransferase